MDAVEDIKSRLSVEDVIGEYVQLKRAGRNFKGLSPWTNEKTPSFMVSPEKQIWHDFSSGRGGDVFSFVMEMEGLDFKGALEHLARKAGLDLSQYQTGRGADNQRLKERLYEALEQAAKFYQVCLTKHDEALEYVFKKRAFTKATALAFRLGYAPDSGTALCDFLTKRHFTTQEIQRAGLITQRYRGPGDMFRGRIMVPLMDAQGRVIGFTARLLRDEPDAPKYINTPQTLLYDKGRHVFGLHLAKEAIRQADCVVVVEGNLDVVASHQAGVRHVVATAGTAMTEAHLKTLSRFTRDLRLAFDQDRAGLAAAERVIPLAGRLDVSLSIIALPEGKDPDDLIKKDPAAWRAAISQAQYALDWLIERHQARVDMNSAAGKRRFSDEILKVVRQMDDSVEQDHYAQKLAAMVGVSAPAMRAKLKTANPHSALRRPKAPPARPPTDAEIVKAQDHLLALTLHAPALRAFLNPIEADMLATESAKKLLAFLKEDPDYDLAKDDQRQLARLDTGQSAGEPLAGDARGLPDYVKMLQLQYEELYQGLDELELGYEAARLQARLIEQYVRAKKALITSALRDADEKRTKELLNQVRALDALLNTRA